MQLTANYPSKFIAGVQSTANAGAVLPNVAEEISGPRHRPGCRHAKSQGNLATRFATKVKSELEGIKNERNQLRIG